jgi:hypothetical protein
VFRIVRSPPGHREWIGVHAFAIVLLLAAAAAAALFLPRQLGLGTHADHTRARMWAFFIVLPLMLAVTVVAGHAVASDWPGPAGLWRWKGLLVDERNRMSLSRFQMLLWTVLLVSGLWTAVLANVGISTANPFSIAVPEQLWWALGLSTASLLGTPLILQRKAHPKPGGSPPAAQSPPADQSPPDPMVGLLAVHAHPIEASWLDMVSGEEVTNRYRIDVARLQMLLFTALLVVGYGFSIAQVLASAAPKITSLPAIDGGFLALLTISHAGYLAKKQVGTLPSATSGP